MAIGAKNRFAWLDDILECLCNLIAVHSWEDLVCGENLPTGASHQYQNPVFSEAAPSFGVSAALSRLSADMLRTLLRLANVRFISLFQAGRSTGFMVHGLQQKAVPPPECCVDADRDFFRRLSDGQAAHHALGISLELLFVL